MGTITEKISYLDGTKTAIKTAIESKGGVIPAGTPFRKYAEAIYALSGGGETIGMQSISASPLGYMIDPGSWQGFQVSPKLSMEQMCDTNKSFMVYFSENVHWRDYPPFLGDFVLVDSNPYPYWNTIWSKEIRHYINPDNTWNDKPMEAYELAGKVWLLRYDGTYFRAQVFGGGSEEQEILEPEIGGYYEAEYKATFVKQGNIVTAYGRGSKQGGSQAAWFINLPKDWAPKRQYAHRGEGQFNESDWTFIDDYGSVWMWGENWGEVPQTVGAWNLDGWSWVVDYSGDTWGGGLACFVGSTTVSTPTGHKSIGKLQIGDIILSYNDKLDKIVEASITNIKSHKEKEFYTLTTVSGEEIKGTGCHILFVSGGGYMPIRKIKKGQKVMDRDFKWVEVAKVERTEEKEKTVYDIATGLGNYFVGKDALLARTEPVTMKEIQ